MLTKAQKKHLLDLQDKKYRQETGQFLLEGIHGIEEALSAGVSFKQLIVEETGMTQEPCAGFIVAAQKAGAQIIPINGMEADRVQTTETFPGVMAVVAIERPSLEAVMENGPVIFLDNIKDPGNLGTIIRTADWFGVKNIVLSESCVDVYNPKVVRATVGSLFHVTVHEAVDSVAAVNEFIKKGYAVNALAMNGKDATLLKQNPKSVYIFGSESHGISPELLALASGVYTIPGKGRAESLNVAVAVGLVLQGVSG